MKKILTYMLFASLITACSSMHKSQTTVSLNGVIETKLKADITVDMSKKLTGTASSSTLFGILDLSGPSKYSDGVFATAPGFLNFGTGPDELKAAAAYNAVVGKADVIVAPQYIVEHKSYLIFSKTTVWVTGYAGSIRKIE